MCGRQIPENGEENKDTIELNHTHCILFDSGVLDEYLADSQRDRFVIEACKESADGHTCMHFIKKILCFLIPFKPIVCIYV